MFSTSLERQIRLIVRVEPPFLGGLLWTIPLILHFGPRGTDKSTLLREAFSSPGTITLALKGVVGTFI